MLSETFIILNYITDGQNKQKKNIDKELSSKWTNLYNTKCFIRLDKEETAVVKWLTSDSSFLTLPCK